MQDLSNVRPTVDTDSFQALSLYIILWQEDLCRDVLEKIKVEYDLFHMFLVWSDPSHRRIQQLFFWPGRSCPIFYMTQIWYLPANEIPDMFSGWYFRLTVFNDITLHCFCSKHGYDLKCVKLKFSYRYDMQGYVK